jgi:hypothetical protein
MRTVLFYPTPELPGDTPIRQIQLPWKVRRKLTDARLKTVGNVRTAANETLLALKLNGVVDYIRQALG